jgi:hypothetical protein
VIFFKSSACMFHVVVAWCYSSIYPRQSWCLTLFASSLLH